jgi:hypothetical protein
LNEEENEQILEFPNGEVNFGKRRKRKVPKEGRREEENGHWNGRNGDGQDGEEEEEEEENVGLTTLAELAELVQRYDQTRNAAAGIGSGATAAANANVANANGNAVNARKVPKQQLNGEVSQSGKVINQCGALRIFKYLK